MVYKQLPLLVPSVSLFVGPAYCTSKDGFCRLLNRQKTKVFKTELVYRVIATHEDQADVSTDDDKL